jgi:hypothetical protein
LQGSACCTATTQQQLQLTLLTVLSIIINCFSPQLLSLCPLSCDVHSQGNTAADAAGAPQPDAAAVVAAAVAAPASAGEPAAAAASTSSSSGAGGVSMLTSAEPIDRLRYQAVLIFNHFDTAKAGQLTADQVQQFFAASARKVRLC